MTTAVVLDAAAFDVLDRPEGVAMRHLLRVVLGRGGEVRCAVLAKLVGAVLHSAGHGSESIADAHVIAGFDAAIVITSDPDDIAELATAMPGTRIVARSPDLHER